MTETNIGTAVQLDLNASLQVENLEETISMVGTVGANIENSGVNRDGGVTNLYTESIENEDADTYASFVSDNGEVVNFVNQDYNTELQIASTGESLGLIPSKWIIGGQAKIGEFLDACIVPEGIMVLTQEAVENGALFKSVVFVINLYTIDLDGNLTFVSKTSVPTAYDVLMQSASFVRYSGITYASFVADKELVFSGVNDSIYGVKNSTFALIGFSAVTNKTGFRVGNFAWKNGGTYIVNNPVYGNNQSQILRATTFPAGAWTNATPTIPNNLLRQHTDDSYSTLTLSAVNSTGTIYASSVQITNIGVVTNPSSLTVASATNVFRAPGMINVKESTKNHFTFATSGDTLSTIVDDGSTAFGFYPAAGVCKIYNASCFDGANNPLVLSLKADNNNANCVSIGNLLNGKDAGAAVSQFGGVNLYGTASIKNDNADNKKAYYFYTSDRDELIIGALIHSTHSDAQKYIKPKKITDNVYALNLASSTNIIDLDNFELLENYSTYIRAIISINPARRITNNVAGLTYITAENKYSNMIDYGAILFEADTLLGGFVTLDGIGSYYVYNSNTERFLFESNKNDLLSIIYYLRKKEPIPYTQNFNLPIPITSEFGQGGVKWITGSAKITDTYADADGENLGYLGYDIRNQLAYPADFFILFGQQYIFDGNWISALPINGSIISAPEKSANASGLTFLASSPTGAYFLSKWENVIYIFDGGRSIKRYVNLNGKPRVIKAYYSSISDDMHVICFDGSNYTTLILNNDTAYEPVSLFADGSSVVTNNLGIIYYNGNFIKKYNYYPSVTLKSSLAETNVNALKWRSAYYGQKDNQQLRVTKIVFSAKVSDCATTDLTAGVRVITADGIVNESKTWLATEYYPVSGNNVVRLEYTLTQQLGLGFSAYFESNKKAVMYEVIMYTNIGGSAFVPVNIGTSNQN